LRRLPVTADPDDDLYHRVMSAHDLHHADRYANTRGQQVTWTDAHSEIGAVAGRALTSGQRTALLGRLALLPPPTSARNLQDTVAGVRGSLPQGLPLAPRSWRDGLGLLYDLRRGTTELEAVLRYAVHAATADRTRAADDGAERALWHWAQEAAADAEGLTRLFRSTLVTERKARLRARGTLVPANPALPAPGAGRPSHPEAVLEIIPRGWEPGRFDWRVSVLPVSGESECIEEDFRGTAFHQLPERLREPLDEAFRRCDEPGHDAALQLAVPGYLVAFAADTWPIGAGKVALGTVRPVVVRRTDAPAWDDPALLAERVDRWHTLHRQQPRPSVLDCDEGAAGPLPGEEELRAGARDTLPVLCRSAAVGPDALHRVARSGFPVALWRREPVEPDAACGDFHRGVARTVRGARFAGRLPGALAALRADVADGVPEAYWSRGLALLYDDPTRPLPGTDELLETP
jgi:hypothetical protein